MKEKKECIIIQDLLPNYIETLTQEETNQYIEEHIKDCKDCMQVLEEMKKEIKVEKPKIEKSKLKYIKKYSKKLKIIKNVALFIVLIITIIIARRAIIINELTIKANNISTVNYKQIVTVYLKSYSDGCNKRETEFYKYGDITLQKDKAIYEDGYNFTTLVYDSPTENIYIVYNDEKREVVWDEKKNYRTQSSSDSSYFISPFKENHTWFFFKNVFEKYASPIYKVNLGRKKCYKTIINKVEYYIEAETGVLVKSVDTNNNEYYYTFEFGKLTKDDVARPET